MVAYHEDVLRRMDLESPAAFQQTEGTVGRRDRPATPGCADGDGGVQGMTSLLTLGDRDSLMLGPLQIDGCSEVYRIKRSIILSEPGMLCEMFATLGLEGDGTPGEQVIGLSNVTPEDFEMLVHFYNDYGSVTLQQSLSLTELTH